MAVQSDELNNVKQNSQTYNTWHTETLSEIQKRRITNIALAVLGGAVLLGGLVATSAALGAIIIPGVIVTTPALIAAIVLIEIAPFGIAVGGTMITLGAFGECFSGIDVDMKSCFDSAEKVETVAKDICKRLTQQSLIEHSEQSSFWPNLASRRYCSIETANKAGEKVIAFQRKLNLWQNKQQILQTLQKQPAIPPRLQISTMEQQQQKLQEEMDKIEEEMLTDSAEWQRFVKEELALQLPFNYSPS